MAIRPRCILPATLEDITADLRAAAREAGLPGVVLTMEAINERMCPSPA
ncbi:hypothetical protein KBZ94_41810 [Streptomyces sp. RM72]|nr:MULTISPECIES: hypothetical protein [unclassified Streptomyces]MBQ0891367.1 hypothetical protein [Streptomyces sp. RM72]